MHLALINRLATPFAVLLVAATFSASYAEQGSPQDSASSKMQLPADAEVQEALGLIREAYETEIAELPHNTAKLVADIKDLSSKTTSPARKYAALLVACDAAIAGSDFQSAIQVVAIVGDTFSLDISDMELDVLRQAADAPAELSDESLAAMYEAAVQGARHAAQGGAIEVAMSLAELSADFSRKLVFSGRVKGNRATQADG